MEHQREQERHAGRISRTATTTTAALVLLTACGASAPEQQLSPVSRVVIEEGVFPEAEDALLRSSFRLGAAMNTEADANRVTSPLSALYALSMLRAGAGTTTAAEMDAVLGLPVEHRDEAMNALLGGLQRFDGDPGMSTRTSRPRNRWSTLLTAYSSPKRAKSASRIWNCSDGSSARGCTPSTSRTARRRTASTRGCRRKQADGSRKHRSRSTNSPFCRCSTSSTLQRPGLNLSIHW